jgi:hypothetical protein
MKSNCEAGQALVVAQVSKPAVSQVSKLARRESFPAHRMTTFYRLGRCGDTAGLETCVTITARTTMEFGLNPQH